MEFYTIDELAKIRGESTFDIWRMISEGKLNISIITGAASFMGLCHSIFKPIDGQAIAGMVLTGTFKGFKSYNEGYLKKYRIDDFVITVDDLDRAKTEYPDLFNLHKQQKIDYITGTDKILAALDVKSFNTAIRLFRQIGIEREYTDEPIPRPQYRSSDMAKVLSMRKKSK